MTAGDRPNRTALFCGLGPHVPSVLRRLRESDPGVRLTALLPLGFDLTGEERALVDEIQTNERQRYSPTEIGPCLRLVRRIRRAHYDTFVVMADSSRLRILAALSGARTRICCHPHGWIEPLHGTLPGIIVRSVARRALGAIVYAILWAVVRGVPTRTAGGGVGSGAPERRQAVPEPLPE
jgi:hypothetical protein